MKNLLFLVFLAFVVTTNAQVAVNTDGSMPDNSAMLDVKSTTQGILIPRMTLIQRNAVASPANGLMVYQTDGTAGFYYYNGTAWTALAGSTGSPSHYVGELFGGGVVFWVDNNGLHGLIASLVNIGTSVLWSGSYTITGAVSTWNGPGNTSIILGISPAAQLCHNYLNSSNYNLGVYADWYLPSLDELNLIYHARYILNKTIESAPAPTNILTTETYYWSSSEFSGSNAWYYNFITGSSTYYAKGTYFAVRAARAF